MKVKRLFTVLMSVVMCGGIFTGVFAGCNKGKGDPDKDDKDDGGSKVSAPLPAGNKIFLVGDSTVCEFADKYYLPRYGYGTQIAEYFNVQSGQVENLALSGRSSKSFLTESNYTTLKNSINSGDYLIIGFGHNDEKQGTADAYRYTNPNKTYTDDSTDGGISFQYNLNENYIKLAKDKGATPILCTPIVRYDASGEYTGNSVHVTADKDGFAGGDYVAAIKTLGQATDTTVIDLTTLTKELYKSNNGEAKYFHAHVKYAGEKPNETPDAIDTTHLNMYGAKAVAYQLAAALKKTGNGLAAHVKENISAPTKAVDYAAAINAEYVRADYTPFNPTSAENASRKLVGDWFKAAMGNLGGDKAGNFKYSVSGNNITVGTNVNTGKIEENESKGAHSDGFGAAFMRISADRNFKASAKAKIVTYNTSAVSTQSGFGMMVRDDIYLDINDTSLNSNYASAGVLGSGGGLMFGRQDKILKKQAKSDVNYSVGTTYDLSIVKENQTIVVKFGNDSFTWTDLDLVAVDNEYVYLCLFATRGIEVEFSSIDYEDTGLSVKA